MSDTSAAPLRIRGPADLLDALPRMLGYRPTGSVVLVAMRPPRARIAVTIRLDLPEPGQETACAGLLARHAAHNHARRAVLVLYDEAGDPGRTPSRPELIAAVREQLAMCGVELTDALAVRVDRWWPLLCADPACCPPEGTLLPGDDEPSVLATTLAAHGCRALPDRAAVVRSIEPVTGAARAVMEQALDRAAEWLGSRPAGEEAVTVVCAETVQAFARAVDRYAERPGLEAGDAARLILGLRDLRARDEILAWAARPDTDALLSLLVDLTRRAVPPLDAPVACALAWVAYARGDGTLANVAVARCLASDPGYTMGRLLRDALEAGVHPRHVRRVSREVSADLRAQRETDQRADGERRDDQRPDDQRTEKP